MGDLIDSSDADFRFDTSIFDKYADRDIAVDCELTTNDAGWRTISEMKSEHDLILSDRLYSGYSIGMRS
jgi:hypothetical protein